MNTPALRFHHAADKTFAKSAKAAKNQCVSMVASWKRKRLGDIGSPYNGLSGKSKADFGHGEGRYVTYMNVFSNPIASSDQCDSIEIDKSQNEVRNGDILFTTSSETPEEVGMSSVWMGDEPNVYLNSFCFGYRPKPGNVSEYLAYLLRARGFREAITFLAQGISRYNISKSRVMEIGIPLPDVVEQRKIGTFFRFLDALIEARAKALEKIESLKKSMLLKMFPQGESLVPEVRFRGFDEEPWKKKCLEEAFLFDVATNTFSRAQLSGAGAVRNIHYGDVLIKYGSVLDVEHEWVPFVADDSFKCSSKNRLKDGDIVMADTAEDEAVGKVTEIRGASHRKIVSGLHTIVLRPLEGYGESFLGYCLNAPAYHESIVSIMQGVKVLSINKSALVETSFCAPSVPEQRKIGSYFRSLDALIAARREEVGKLKQMKKAMLERMFV